MPTVLLTNVCAALPKPPDATNVYIANAAGAVGASGYTEGYSMNANYFYKVPLASGLLTATNSTDAIFTFKYVEGLVPPTYIGTIPNLSTSNPLITGDSRLRVLSTGSRSGTNDIIAFFPGGVVKNDALFYLLTLPPASTVTAAVSLGTALNTAVTLNVATAYYLKTTPWAMSTKATMYFYRTTTEKQKFFVTNDSFGTEVDVNLPTANLSSTTRFEHKVSTSIGAGATVISAVVLPANSIAALNNAVVAADNTITWMAGITYTATLLPPTQDQLQMNLAYERASVEFNILQISSIVTGTTADKLVGLSAPSTSSPALTLSSIISTGSITPGQKLLGLGGGALNAPTVVLQTPSAASPVATTPVYVTISLSGVLGSDVAGTGPVVYESYFSFGATKYNKGYFAFIDSSVVSGENSYTMTTGDFAKYCALTTTGFVSTDSATEVQTLLNSSSPATGQAFATRPGVWYIDTISEGSSSNFNLRYKAKDAADGTPATELYLCGGIADPSASPLSWSWKGSTDKKLATVFTCMKCSPLNGYCMPAANSDLEYSSYITVKGLDYSYENPPADQTTPGKMLLPSLTIVPNMIIGNPIKNSTTQTLKVTSITTNTISAQIQFGLDEIFNITYNPTRDYFNHDKYGKYFNTSTSISIPTTVNYSEGTNMNFKYTNTTSVAGIQVTIERAISIPGRVIGTGSVITFKGNGQEPLQSEVVSVTTGATPSFLCANNFRVTFGTFVATPPTNNYVTISSTLENVYLTNIITSTTKLNWVSGGV